MILNHENFSITHITKKSKISNSKRYVDFQTEREQHLKYSLEKTLIKGQILEFGVFEGTTINIMAEKFNDQIVWGFDSFEGLPEDWIRVPNNKELVFVKGYFKLESLPKVRENVRLVKGWFNQTIPQWIEKNQQPLKLLHIDCDLYSSAKDVLFMLNNLIVPGTLIIFDEIYHWRSPKKYTNWKNGEYKALLEWMREFGREIIPVCRSRYMQCSIEVVK